jgi:hypothetical protein
MVEHVSTKQIGNSVKRYDKAIIERSNVPKENFFSVTENLQSEYDMWSWIFAEISTLRIEVSRLGTLVRLNNPSSPNFLEAYHAQLYALMVPASPLINFSTWKKIDSIWMTAKMEIDTYLSARKVSPTKKIPFEVIRNLDKLYRISLIILQRAGLGVRTVKQENIEDSLEAAIAGD